MPDLNGGWYAQNSHIRGTFTAHWISAAAYLIAEVPNARLKAKMDHIVDEIRRCQIENGGKLGFPIPPKYIYGVKEGKTYWAPLYVCNKVFMGLLDVYQLTHNQTTLDIITGCGEWFTEFTSSTSRQELSEMMDSQETGGLMEIWGDLYQATQNEC